MGAEFRHAEFEMDVFVLVRIGNAALPALHEISCGSKFRQLGHYRVFANAADIGDRWIIGRASTCNPSNRSVYSSLPLDSTLPSSTKRIRIEE